MTAGNFFPPVIPMKTTSASRATAINRDKLHAALAMLASAAVSIGAIVSVWRLLAG